MKGVVNPFVFYLHKNNAVITVQGTVFNSEMYSVTSVHIQQCTITGIGNVSAITGMNSAVTGLQEKLNAYLNGEVIDFGDIAVTAIGQTPFQQQVLSAVRLIPYGSCMSYSQLAAQCEKPKAVRAAASAVRKNPVPLIIPCHRVIRKNGQCGRYCGEAAPFFTKFKATLLRREQMSNHLAGGPVFLKGRGRS